jgi:predicted DNA-binding transcriptional regulator YafY
MPASADVTQRVLDLAAYIAHERTFTLDRATLDVPGYSEVPRGAHGEILDTSTPAHEALRSTFRRDLDALKTAFGIEARYDAQEGRYELQPPFFSRAERRALIAASAAVEVSIETDRDHDPERLGAAVGDDEAEVFLEVTDTIRLLIEAAHRRRGVHFVYEGKPRRLQPWAVGMWRRHWYVVGHDRDVSDRRTFRIERIRDVGLLEDEFDVPADFDRETALDMDPNRWGTDPPLHIELDVNVAFAPRLAHLVGGEITARDEDRATVETESKNHEALIDRLLELGTQVRIVSPDAVVAAMCERLRQMAELP